MPEIVPFDELEKTRKADKIVPFDRLEKKPSSGIVAFDQLSKRQIPEMEKPSWVAKHPTLYGLYGAARGIAYSAAELGKIGLIKYADPHEAKKLMRMTPKAQRRQLLMDTLELEAVLAFGAAKPKVKVPAKIIPKVAKLKPIPEVPKLDEVKLISRVQTALRSAKIKRKEQALLYTKERKLRIAKAKKAGEGLRGEARHRAELRALEGPMQQVEFKTLKGKVSQTDVEDLFALVYAKIPNFYHQKTAGRGLAKLFGEYGGNVPQDSELKLLRRVFPESFIKDLLAARPTWKKMSQLGYEAINVPRALMASFDLSAPLRQGIFLAPSHPIRFAQSFVKMFRQFGSERTFQAAQAAIEKKATYPLMQEYGLALTDLGAGMAAREEAFMGGQLAERIPLFIGRIVRASARAHTGFLKKFRADVFEDFVKNAAKAGINIADEPKLGKALAGFINAGTGRGNLGALENSAVLLNSLFFSPRLMSSRLHLLNPIYYARLPAPVRKEALKSLFAFTAMIGTTLGVAKAAGLKVGANPYSADFGKIIVGKTRIDILGGFQQYIRSAAQLIRKRYVSSTTGKEFTLGEGYKPMTRAQIVQRQIESKLAPPTSFAWALLKQQDIATGKPINVPKEIAKRFVPMVMQDIYDLYKEDPSLIPLGGLGMFGVGLQTYGPRRRVTGRGIRGLEMIKGLKGIK